MQSEAAEQIGALSFGGTAHGRSQQARQAEGSKHSGNS